jgi:hypothetical protein
MFSQEIFAIHVVVLPQASRRGGRKHFFIRAGTATIQPED